MNNVQANVALVSHASFNTQVNGGCPHRNYKVLVHARCRGR